ncbi:uncharacterized protein TRAVEDRAFT_49100 [Trametes versicolor FP-101664 SS1]|uniref:uncharacterized protein n=1 Tax=Trametes versicolor (strain FP-101664) TaxID=717944 RepID=UPI00046215BE|nr:uncharacterized protein TRAVEDRAFT_49100 [Trametes versicolor FP-101664 SS1]EIW56261.1 hypothetical protein TRAVEDRAFT_49100 [Trametes versicolor FP-101664 SS1]
MSDDALQFNPTELSSARRLVDKAAKHTHKEELRVEAMVDLSTVHEDILVEVTLQLSTNPPKKIIPDGRIRATSNYQHLSPILSLTEVNSEVGAGTCDPIDKAKQDYRAIYCSEKFKPFRDVSCCPCLNAARSADRLPTCYVGPHLTHVSADGTAISLDYTGRLCTGEPAKTLYTARARITSDPAQDPRETDVVVKFTKAYSLEGHRLLAVHGLAPKLWFCEWVESVDMYVVVMDHVRDAETADEDVAMSVADAAAVRTAVELLHAAGLVFGDLRGPNVLLRKDGGPLLIDFDWCGPEGTACYPLGVNMHSAIPWHPDVNTGALIKKEHDLHLLKALTGS